ncbi:MAG: hypothetical protein J6F30_08385, partial [Cellulosilyticum sp.]|nr:hypothetical protein [Cellulosilyticum sp.]
MKSRLFVYIFFIVTLLGFGLNAIYLYCTPHYTPKIAKLDLKPILHKDSLNCDDYTLLFEQTGLSAAIIDELRSSPDFENKILLFQKNYLAELETYNLYMPPATFCQLAGSSPKVKDQSKTTAKSQTKAFTIAPYHNGYILATNATHSFGWRHGHLGLVVDEIHGYTLEAIHPGTVSCLQNIHKWEYYPTFKLLRLKDLSLDEHNNIANYALAYLKGLPYNILGAKHQNIPSSTHCSLLIWQAFDYFGYDLDSTGGPFVSPKDIVCSPLLEVLQIYGFDPN